MVTPCFCSSHGNLKVLVLWKSMYQLGFHATVYSEQLYGPKDVHLWMKQLPCTACVLALAREQSQ